jgi:hypothetical protein
MKNWNMLMALILLLSAAFFIMPLAMAIEESMGSVNESQMDAYKLQN